MADSDNTLLLNGQVIGFTPPTEGQVQAMIRIGRTMKAGTDDSAAEFWQTQIYRVGQLLFNLVNEADREAVEEMYLNGTMDHRTLLDAIMGKVNADAVSSEDKAIAKAKGKASAVRVQRK